MKRTSAQTRRYHICMAARILEVSSDKTEFIRFNTSNYACKPKL